MQSPVIPGHFAHHPGTANHGRHCHRIQRPEQSSSSIYQQACRYLVKDFGTSESPKSTRQRDSRYAPT
ncbi:MAG: hypothetical protein KZQ65_06555, partial [Candidatus Thiodiazotropha sp. (ex Gloverina cf. vestifex)]|nr:hypothetical protein [Candidatus Thiodiazotropha sp. (ex Gloverina cf. vestifex)]